MIRLDYKEVRDAHMCVRARVGAGRVTWPAERGVCVSCLLTHAGEELTKREEEMTGRDWGQEEKGTTEDEMAG